MIEETAPSPVPSRNASSRRGDQEAHLGPGSGVRAAPRIAGLALATISLLCAWWSVTIYRQWAHSRESLVAELRQAGVDSQEVYDRVQREPVAHHAQLDTARALVFQLLQAPSIDSLPVEERQAGRDLRLANLLSANRLARSALARQPNSWEAAMLQGATTYLTWSVARDRRLFTESDTWQKPLIKALQEAPGRPEPRRILGTAYLELWPALSAEKRAFATDLLRSSFAEDPDAFKQLGPAWLETAADGDQAMEIIPDRPRAWEIAARHYAERGRWRQYQRAYLDGLDSLEHHLVQRLEDGKTRLLLGDDFHSRTRFARVIADAPPDQRFVPYVDDALALYPAGLQAAGTGKAMPHWLAWTLKLAELGIPSLAPPSIDRLAGTIENLPPPSAAMAALVAGELHIAERLERLDRVHSTSTWAPYLIAKAGHLLALGDVEDTATTLSRVGSLDRRRPRYALVKRLLAEREEDLQAVAEADRLLASLRTNNVAAESWYEAPKEIAQGGSLLEIFPATAGTTLVIQVAAAPPRGSVVRLRLDGAVVAVAEVRGAGRSLRVEIPLSTDPHLIEWLTLAGDAAVPGSVRIE